MGRRQTGRDDVVSPQEQSTAEDLNGGLPGETVLGVGDEFRSSGRSRGVRDRDELRAGAAPRSRRGRGPEFIEGYGRACCTVDAHDPPQLGMPAEVVPLDRRPVGDGDRTAEPGEQCSHRVGVELGSDQRGRRPEPSRRLRKRHDVDVVGLDDGHDVPRRQAGAAQPAGGVLHEPREAHPVQFTTPLRGDAERAVKPQRDGTVRLRGGVRHLAQRRATRPPHLPLRPAARRCLPDEITPGAHYVTTTTTSTARPRAASRTTSQAPTAAPRGVGPVTPSAPRVQAADRKRWRGQ